jgi:hypothetical protein
MEEKKPWITPELIVLTRTNPEEQVLYSCKGGYITHDANANNNGCNMTTSCFNCTGIGSS